MRVNKLEILKTIKNIKEEDVLKDPDLLWTKSIGGSLERSYYSFIKDTIMYWLDMGENYREDFEINQKVYRKQLEIFKEVYYDVCNELHYDSISLDKFKRRLIKRVKKALMMFSRRLSVSSDEHIFLADIDESGIDPFVEYIGMVGLKVAKVRKLNRETGRYMMVIDKIKGNQFIDQDLCYVDYEEQVLAIETEVNKTLRKIGMTMGEEGNPIPMRPLFANEPSVEGGITTL